MNSCLELANLDEHQFMIDKLNQQVNRFSSHQSQQFQQNCSKIILPGSIIRSSSLSKISDSNKKCIQSPIGKTEKEKCQNSLASKINQKKNVQKQIKQKKQKHLSAQSNVKSAIFNKLLQKNQNSNNLLQKTHNKENQNQKQIASLLPAQSFYHKHQNKNKLISIFKQKTERQLKQCTFNPKINFNSQNIQKQFNSKQFFNQQMQLTKRTEDKIQQMRLMIKSQKQKQNTFQPKISEETAQLTQRRSKFNVYDRLYAEHKDDKLGINKQDSINREKSREEIRFKRQSSKKSITFISNKKKTINNEDQCNQSLKKYSQIYQNISKQIKKQKSFKTQSRSGKVEDENQKNDQIFQQLRSQSNASSQFTSKQHSEKKNYMQTYGVQLLDCRQLIRQKQRSNNLLPKQKSCKLVSKFINRNSKKQIKSQLSHEKSSQIKQKVFCKTKMSEKNQKIALQKFTKQFFTVINKINLNERIDFIQMITLMKNMNFIESLQQFEEENPYCKSQTQNQRNVNQIWLLLEGDQNKSVLLINLFKIFCSIAGYHNNIMIDQALKNVGFIYKFHQSSGNEGKTLILTQKDSKSIKKDFNAFYLTRFKLGQSKLVAKQTNYNQFSFRPSISKESLQYADKYREKIVEQSQKLLEKGLINFKIPEDGLIDHNMLLILDQKIKNYKLNQMRQQAARQKRKVQDESMMCPSLTNRSNSETFQRSFDQHKVSKNQEELNSNIFSRISHNQTQSRSKEQIFVQLYQNGLRSRSNRIDRGSDEIQYEQAKDELTFKPKINKSKSIKQFNSSGSTNLHEIIPNFTKQIMRIRNPKIAVNSLSTSPLLYLNITMEGNDDAKIPVYQSDTFASLTEKVRVLMNISDGEEEKRQLKLILKDQIIPSLNKIGIKSINGSLLFSD